MNKLQIILLTIFGVVGVVAVLMFAGILPGFKDAGPGEGKGVELLMWGTFPAEKIKPLISKINDDNQKVFKISYTEKDPLEYEGELVNAMAAGSGPDIWVLTPDMIFKEKDKVAVITSVSYQERDFKDAFIDSASVFMKKYGTETDPTGIFGVPLAVDPIVLYWNKDLFSSAGVAKAPVYWDEFLTNVHALVKTDEAGNITQAGAAMGEFKNVKNAKDILSMLILQTGNSILELGEKIKISFGEKGNRLINPTENAVKFFNEISNPNKTSYSWNEALPNSEIMFTNGLLAMYFGYAGEIGNIKQKNPHLNFDLANVPQIRSGDSLSGIKATYGKIYSLAISKNSTKKQTALTAIISMSGPDFSKVFSESFRLGSARRDVLQGGSSDPILSIVYKSAIMSRTWLEPDSTEVYGIFKNMIESIITGRVKVSDAVNYASKQLKGLTYDDQN